MAKWLKNGKSEKEIVEADAEVRKTVEKILQDVAKRGDEAVRELSIKFDNYSPDNFILSKEEIETAISKVSKRNYYSGGDHQILVGEVTSFDSFELEPLTYWNGKIS